MSNVSFYTQLIQKKTKPLIMGILNLTPDSFYDGGKHTNITKSIKHVEKMIREGADIIDIGAVSSRPGASEISLEIERKRLFPVLEKIKYYFPHIPLSVDTYRYQIAEEAIKVGVNIINNINIQQDQENMLRIVQKNQLPYILMHIKGIPSNMQDEIHYDDFEKEILLFFEHYINKLYKIGITKIILDPGFGFGKTLNQNYIMLNMIPKLKEFGHPVLVGVSRKSMISKLLNIETQNTLNGTSIINMVALMYGTNIIRVHDVKEAKEAIKIFNTIKKNETCKK
jgi:dihydropteroate synthase